MSKTQEFRVKIKKNMDLLQEMMETQLHIENPGKVEAQLNQCSLYWAFLDDEDKDYIHCAQNACEEKTVWRV